MRRFLLLNGLLKSLSEGHDAFILATNSKKTRAIEHLDIVAVANDAEMENNLSFSITSHSSSDVDDNEGASMVPAMFPHAKTKI